MKLEYTTQGTCSRKITIDVNNGIVENVSFSADAMETRRASAL